MHSCRENKAGRNLNNGRVEANGALNSLQRILYSRQDLKTVLFEKGLIDYKCGLIGKKYYISKYLMSVLSYVFSEYVEWNYFLSSRLYKSLYLFSLAEFGF